MALLTRALKNGRNVLRESDLRRIRCLSIHHRRASNGQTKQRHADGCAGSPETRLPGRGHVPSFRPTPLGNRNPHMLGLRTNFVKEKRCRSGRLEQSRTTQATEPGMGQSPIQFGAMAPKLANASASASKDSRTVRSLVTVRTSRTRAGKFSSFSDPSCRVDVT